jgi:N-acetylmuramoyl-L-alanine amidase
MSMTNDEFAKLLQRHHGGRRLVPYTALVDTTILRLLIRGEAEGESAAGQLAVAHVVLNRIRHATWWGTTTAQVALWPHQFSCFWADFNVRHAAIDEERRAPTPQIARMVDHAVYAIDDDPTNGAVYYWNPEACTPPWSDRITVVRTIGRHVFAIDTPPVPVAPPPVEVIVPSFDFQPTTKVKEEEKV